MSAKRVTSKDVADRAGVSRTTVSMVLNNVLGVQISEETRRRVIQAAEELGYVPDAAAQALASRRSQIVGLVLSRNPHHIASDAFLNQVLDGLIEAVHHYGMRLLLDIVEEEHQKDAYRELVRAKRIDGLILSGPRSNDDALRALEKNSFPTVLIGQLPETRLCYVDVDNCEAARQAVAHLIRLGHRRIACITNAPVSYTAAADRHRGYRQAVEAAGIAYDEALVRYGDFSPESGYYQMIDLLENGVRPTALFVASDVVAIGAKTALTEWNLRVPQDVALIGFDDIPLARFSDPPLTTIHLPAGELARQASDLLIQLINGTQPLRKHLLLNTSLVVRGSCGANRESLTELNERR